MSSTYDFQIEQGVTFQRTITVHRNDVIVDLTGYSAALDIRPFADSPRLILGLTDVSGLTLNGITGEIDLIITATQTATFGFSSAVYDLKLTDAGGASLPRLRGKVKVTHRVTI